jgi:hypothetical protein
MNKPGRPLNSGAKYLSLQMLLERFKNPNFCVPISSSFIKKYNLLDEKVNHVLSTVPKERIDIKMINFEKEDEE